MFSPTTHPERSPLLFCRDIPLGGGDVLLKVSSFHTIPQHGAGDGDKSHDALTIGTSFLIRPQESTLEEAAGSEAGVADS
ncbi:hypothetical protein E2C01_047679 [Portunus trituberculatus]|uniref:Uncharacterized protein n=1 Tax=Portunus trituberculatus TaxID=210409 RepID=A0A5B7G852_PORTR|nr:hypothetical protein [Portunus trituberculatus]